MFDFAKEMNFEAKAQGKNSNRDGTHLKLPKSPGLLIFASGFSNKTFLPSDPDEICDGLKLLL